MLLRNCFGWRKKEKGQTEKNQPTKDMPSYEQQFVFHLSKYNCGTVF
jgi:hypothetical protein